ncbi:MAG: CTP synthase, partial [Coriobacteriales bacterium]
IVPGTLAEEVYQAPVIYERHRHRYEFNNQYRQLLTDAGLVIGGMSPDERLVEMIELPREVHPYFIASQGHPEFKSRPTRCHPLFNGLIAAAIKCQGGAQ